jgi:spore maturation protein CgeB
MSQVILIVGFNNDEALESSYARAFQKLGWSVHFWTPIQALHRVSRGQRLGRLFGTFVHVEPWWRKANLELLQLADRLQPNILLVVGTEGVRAGTLAQIKVRIPQCLIYCVYPDSPHNLDDDRINCLPFFERVTTSSPAWVDAFSKLGATNVQYLPFAADTDVHFPVNGSSPRPPAHDLTFIGTWRTEREDILEQLCDFDLCVWGSNYWKTRTRTGSPLRARWGGRSIKAEEFPGVAASSRIMLNVVDAATWPGPNMRTFEQAACGAFSLTTRSPAVLEIFTEGENIECFDSVEEARDKIRFYLSHEDDRLRIANAAREFVVNHGHTYMDRANQIIEWAKADERLG